MMTPKQSCKTCPNDAIESKLFGIGVKACSLGNHQYYLGYALRKNTLQCQDMGHFHPSENIADKLLAVAFSLPLTLLQVSRPIR